MNSGKECEDLVEIIREKVSQALENTNKSDITSLDLETAIKFSKAAIKKSNELGIKVVIAVTDKNGNLILLNRMEDSLIASIELAGKKAYTSVVLNMCTSEVLKCGLDEIVSSMEGKIVAFGGGLPVRINGKLIGGIGISGGTVEQDIEIAQYAVNAVLN